MTSYFYKISIEDDFGDYDKDDNWYPVYVDKIVEIEDTGKKTFNLESELYNILWNYNLNPNCKPQFLGKDLNILSDISR